MAEYYAQRGDELREVAPDERAWRRLVDTLDPEVDNIRVALAAAVASDDVELKVRLAGGLWRFWAIRGPVGEGLAWIERALAAEGPATAARACALQGGAGLAWRLGNDDRAQELAQVAVPVAIAASSAWDERSAHTMLGILAKARNDFPSARGHHQRAVEITEGLGFEPVIEMQNLGSVALEAREYQEATARFEDVLARAERNDNVWAMALAHLGLGIAQYELGDLERSRRAFEGATEISEALGLRELLAHSWQGLAVVGASESDFERSAFLLGRARRVLNEFGGPEDLFWDERLPETRARAREALGDEAFEAAYSAGLDPAQGTLS
jgi:tetratricopeptide (TPR) repeat protein